MRRPRITIAGLLGVVAFVGVAFAALRAATDTWDSGVFGGTLSVLTISVLMAIHRTGLGRASWLGFALFGWAYLLMSLLPPVEARLPTTKALAYLDSKLARRRALPARYFTPDGRQLLSQPATVRVWDVASGRALAGPSDPSENFVRIGHSLFTMAFALVGGILSRRLSLGPGITRRPVVIAAGGSGQEDRGRTARGADDL